MFRKLFLAALIVASVSVAGAAQAQQALPPAITQQILQMQAAIPSNEAFADAVATLAQNNPALAAAIMGRAAQARPAAAGALAQAGGARLGGTGAGAAAAQAIVNALPPQQQNEQGATLLQTFVFAAPAAAQNQLMASLGPAITQFQTAAGNPGGSGGPGSGGNPNYGADAVQERIQNFGSPS